MFAYIPYIEMLRS